jgi:hypothetical protein
MRRTGKLLAAKMASRKISESLLRLHFVSFWQARIFTLIGCENMNLQNVRT